MAAQPEARSTDGETRRQIMLLLLKHSPLSASDIGDHLGLSAAGVRRHLDNLVEDELAAVAAADQRNPSGLQTKVVPTLGTTMTRWPHSPSPPFGTLVATKRYGNLRAIASPPSLRMLCLQEARKNPLRQQPAPSWMRSAHMDTPRPSTMQAVACKSASIIAQSHTLPPNFRNCVRLNMKQLRSYWDNMCSRSPPSLMDTASAPPTSHQKISL